MTTAIVACVVTFFVRTRTGVPQRKCLLSPLAIAGKYACVPIFINWVVPLFGFCNVVLYGFACCCPCWPLPIVVVFLSSRTLLPVRSLCAPSCQPFSGVDHWRCRQWCLRNTPHKENISRKPFSSTHQVLLSGMWYLYPGNNLDFDTRDGRICVLRVDTEV